MPLAVALLESSFAQVRANAPSFAADFYARLFADHPETRALFEGVDMVAQQKKLMDSLVLVVENVENGDVLGAALAQLGRKHTAWRIEKKHYDMVGSALLATFAQHLGATWTPELREAWADAYGVVVSLMTKHVA